MSTYKPTAEIEGWGELLRGLNKVDKELRRVYNGEIRNAAKACAAQLKTEMEVSATSRLARRVAAVSAVRSDRYPTLVMGGHKKFRAKRSPGDRNKAGAVVWGTESGGTKFPGARPWIAPTVDMFIDSGAVDIYARSVAKILKRAGVM